MDDPPAFYTIEYEGLLLQFCQECCQAVAVDYTSACKHHEICRGSPESGALERGAPRDGIERDENGLENAQHRERQWLSRLYTDYPTGIRPKGTSGDHERYIRVRTDGWGCKACSYVSPSADDLREHYRKKHPRDKCEPRQGADWIEFSLSGGCAGIQINTKPVPRPPRSITNDLPSEPRRKHERSPTRPRKRAYRSTGDIRSRGVTEDEAGRHGRRTKRAKAPSTAEPGMLDDEGPAWRWVSSAGALELWDPIEKAERRIIYVSPTPAQRARIYSCPDISRFSALMVVIQPTTTTQRDMLARLAALGVEAALWTGETPARDVAVVLMTPQDMKTREWGHFTQTRAFSSRIAYMILEEAQQALYSTSKHHQSIMEAALEMEKLRVNRAYLVSTVLYGEVGRVRRGLGMKEGEGVRTVRCQTSTTRPNVSFRWTDMEPSARGVQEACKLATGRQKTLVYIHVVELAGRWATRLGFSFAGSDDARERHQVIRRWESEGGVLVTTGAIDLQADLNDVALVVCCMPLYSANAVQAFDWAGRDGRPATAVLLESEARARLTLGSLEDCGFLTGCRRLAVQRLRGDDAKGQCGPHDEMCDFCAASAAEPAPAPTLDNRPGNEPAPGR